MSGVVEHVVAAIGEPSKVFAEEARAWVAAHGESAEIERIAGVMAGAQHGRPRAAKRAVVVVGMEVRLVALEEIAAATHTPVISIDAEGLEAGIALSVSLAEQLGGLDVLAVGAVGGAEPSSGRIDALAGLILGAASVNAVIVLDGPATGAAAQRAMALAPNVAGYVLAGHAGAGRGFDPVFDVGLGTGDGAGAAVILPFVLRAASL